MEFKIKTKASIHNKFHVEVRNADSGELKQEGFAENIVTDMMYSSNELMGFRHPFTSISFGGGVGTPTPSNTRLFDAIGSKSATVEERIWAYPVSSVTKSVELGTTEFNGTTITEVGIGGQTTLNTHAMLKDAEGNPLSIEKTSSDVITIYATLYIELVDDPQAKGKFNQIPNYNPIVLTVIDESWVSVAGLGVSNNGVMVGSAGGPAPYNYMKLIDKRLGMPKYYSGFDSITRDLDNRKIKWETRLDVNSANFDIEEIGLALGGGPYKAGVNTRYRAPELAYRLDLTDSYVWTPYRLKDLELGTGDGLNTEFNIGRPKTSDIEVKVDGQVVNDYTLRNVNDNNKDRMSLLDFIDEEEELSYALVHNIGEGLGINHNSTIKFNDDIIGKQLSFYSTTSSSRVTGHRDGASYNIPLVGNTIKRTAVIEENYDYFTFSGLATSQPIIEDPDYVQPAVVFNNPPADGVPVTISYTVPYIPKTEDYVLDLSFEIEWL